MSAVHEAGHAVVGLIHGVRVERVTLDPPETVIDTRPGEVTLDEYLEYLIAGRAADRVIDGKGKQGHLEDDERVVKILSGIYGEEAELTALARTYLEMAFETVERHKTLIKRVAAALEDTKELTVDEVLEYFPESGAEHIRERWADWE